MQIFLSKFFFSLSLSAAILLRCQKQPWNMTTTGQASKNNMAPWPEGALVRHPLPAIDSSTLFCSNFLSQRPNLAPLLQCVLFFPGIFSLNIFFFFLLNVKFLQTLLTVYRSALVISADVCCRCWNCRQSERERKRKRGEDPSLGSTLAHT